MHQLISIQRALQSIETRLRQPLTIERLAREVGMSHWHFQRSFTAMVGEPVGRYIRKRRLSDAAYRLSGSDQGILEIALDCQFESHEAFTRAFKSELGVTPSAWRRGEGKPDHLRRKEPLTHSTLTERFRHMNLSPELVELPERSFAGLQARFITAASPNSNNLNIIPTLWASFFERLSAIPLREPGVFYGLAESPEAHGVERAHPDEVLYLAAAEVAPDSGAPEDMEIWRSPGGLFAKFLHRGRVERIGETVSYIYGKWMPQSEFTAGDGPDLERYDSSFDPASDDSVLEILIPVRR